ncbi:MAG: hypothetical protein JJ928_04385 [Psychroserpens sp.]|uniref:hypothetical protein n=1 Tax=Psychroserpens sp. TaxID=2020870 RepID=UPI001B2DA4A2|nr:hypothetical protein [Psychroserpens sp.]MBO6606516.1 hypothetical protein [Psychroserpens sp.]MBO6653220.1 hypothetical protein [Psychroserpens sp.]MBO6914771.1 hypothetical protein [Psychroserpens sp.]
MILTITLVLSFLVAINFLLLVFSCNKTTKRVVTEEKTVIKPIKPAKQLATSQLAPTGS